MCLNLRAAVRRRRRASASGWVDCSGAGACGDWSVDQGEDCDDGNVLDGDGCGSHCGAGDCVLFEGLFFCTTPRTWFSGRARCETEGAALALPRDDAGQDAVVAGALERSREDWWIGIDDRAAERTWVGPDGAEVAFESWAPDRPNGGRDQNCVVLDAGFDGGWNDKACTEEHPVVCEP